MSAKNSCTTADIIEWSMVDYLYKIAFQLKNYKICGIILAGAFYGLKYSELINLKWKDVLSNTFSVQRKGGKKEIINNHLEAIKKFRELSLKMDFYDYDGYVIVNHLGNRPAIQTVNNQLKVIKDIANLQGKNISTETFRKTFGKHIYDLLPLNMKASGLDMLTQYFGHSNNSITRKYIGLEDDFTFDSPTQMLSMLYENSNNDDDWDNIPKLSSFVYIMKDNNVPNAIKIGKANNPKQRERTLMAEKPSISLLLCHREENEKDAFILEKKLHKEFDKYRIRGEWFELPQKEYQRLLSKVEWKDYTKIYGK